MKYDDLKEEIKSIAEVANTVPEAFRDRCFELLLQHLLTSSAGGKKLHHNDKEDTPASETGGSAQPSAPPVNGKIPTPSQVKVFMQKTGITLPDLEQVLIFEDGHVHFIHEPSGQKIARGQIEWALLLALKNGIENNVLSVDPEGARSICQEKHFYDPSNFGKNFKVPSNAALFSGPMEKQGETQKLTVEGQKELATIIRDLAPKAQ